MTPLERAGRALYEQWLAWSDVQREAALNGPHPDWDKLGERAKARWIVDASAVVAAIRVPSVAMIDEAYSSYDANGGSLRDVFMDMIDAALAEA